MRILKKGKNLLKYNLMINTIIIYVLMIMIFINYTGFYILIKQTCNSCYCKYYGLLYVFSIILYVIFSFYAIRKQIQNLKGA